MREQNRPFEDIHDLIGIRIITPTMRDCYAALGLIHSHWVPVTGRFKDYIAMPKINLYQSLHTTVIGPDGKPLEVQIRTEEMHRRAEAGIAAHWRYKEGEAGPLPRMDFLSWGEDEDPEEFLANLKLDLYQDEVFVLTPGGDVKPLPAGSTAIDFAYSVHTEVGHRCVGARINGRLVPLSTRLQSGDIIEVLTSKSIEAGPSRDWLAFVRTGRAKSKIRQWFTKERRDRSAVGGQGGASGPVQAGGSGIPASEKETLLESISAELGQKDVEALQVAVGEGTVSIDSVATRLAPADQSRGGAGRVLPSPSAPIARHGGGGGRGPGRHADPSRPLLFSGARRPDRGLRDRRPGRLCASRRLHQRLLTRRASRETVEVAWPPRTSTAFVVWIQVEALDRTRLLRDVTSVISDTGGNITASSTHTGDDRVAMLRYEVELSDPSQLPKLLSDLRGVDGVFSSFRLATDPSS